MKRLSLTSVLLLCVACNGNIVTINSVHPEKTDIDVITIYEAPYRDLISITYDELNRAATSGNFRQLNDPYIGYEWRRDKIKCRYRFIPVTGTSGLNKKIVGYFSEFSISGGLPASSVFNPKSAVENVSIPCLKVDLAITKKLEEEYAAIEVDKYQELGKYEKVFWTHTVDPELINIAK